MRIRKLSITHAAAALEVLALGAMPAFGADHRDSPLTKDAPKSDINDFYVWKLPNGKEARLLSRAALPLPPAYAIVTTNSTTSMITNDLYHVRFDDRVAKLVRGRGSCSKGGRSFYANS